MEYGRDMPEDMQRRMYLETNGRGKTEADWQKSYAQKKGGWW